MAWKEGVQKNAQFSFHELSFEEFNLVFVTAERLACFEPGR